MKILILANNDVGLYQFRKELIYKLLETNKVYISLPYGELVDPLVEEGCTFIDTPVDRRGMNPITDMGLFLNYLKMIKKIQPDLVISYTIKPGVYGGLACRLLRIPFDANITGLGTAFQNEGLLKKLVVAMYKVSMRKAHTVFFENSENRSLFLREHIVRRKQTCLLHGAGVNLEHYTVLDYPDSEITRFLFVGRVMKEKGVDELFDAMKRLYSEGEKIHLDVLGGYEEDYEPIIREYEKEGWLTYHGYQKDVRPFIADSHCFVLPSWHEGMANTNLECAASGRPVITSNIAGCKEAVQDGNSGYLCESKDSSSLYHCMRKFLQLNYDDRKHMGLEGHKRMEKYFNKDEVIVKTLERL